MEPKVVPYDQSEESVGCFCIFPRTKSDSYNPGPSGNTPVYLNVYDITHINGLLSLAGIGLFHTGVEVYGVEYGFGNHNNSCSGVFEIEPRSCPGFMFRKSILIGTTSMGHDQVEEFMENQSVKYYGNTYNFVLKNCNHFCDEICYKLTGNRIPKWINRPARIGSICHWLLPRATKCSNVRVTSNFLDDEHENESLRSSSFPYFSSTPEHQKEGQVSMSSLILYSLYKRSQSPYEWEELTTK